LASVGRVEAGEKWLVKCHLWATAMEADGAPQRPFGPLRVTNRRFSKASGAAAPERIAADPASNGMYAPGSSRSWAGLQPAGMCHKATFAVPDPIQSKVEVRAPLFDVSS